MTGCGGTSSGCCFNKYRKELVFETKQKARESAAKYLREYFKENGDHPNGNTNSNVLIALQEVFTPQLEIFVA